MSKSSSMHPENETFADWMRDLVQQFASLDATQFSNLSSLTAPTQLYAVLFRIDHAYRVVVLVSHDPTVPHGVARAFEFTDLHALASAAESLDTVLSTPAVPAVEVYHGRPVSALALSCLSLADLMHWSPQARTTPEATVVFHGLSLLETANGKAALWQFELRLPLISPQVFLRHLHDASPRPRSRAEVIVVQPEYVMSLATFCEPLVWFGDPPYQSIGDRILRRQWTPTRAQRSLLSRTVSGVPLHFLNTGMIVAETSDRVRALALFNQVAAVVSRCIIPQRVIRAEELVELRSYDPRTTRSDGGGHPVCRRNRLLFREQWYDGMSIDSVAVTPSFESNRAALSALVDAVERTIGDKRLATESSRLLTASSLQERSFFTEAFVIAWSVIESVIGKSFEETWLSLGRGKRRAEGMERDWRVAQQIDLLIVRKELTTDQADRLHRLRRIRNDLIHGLREAIATEVEDCIAAAGEMARLPRPDVSWTVRVVPL